jgi:N-acylneuraminate cytidylyltransferase
MEVLALIPARGGSKSLPRKNVLPLAGHPLLAWSVAAGLQAETVTRTIVSTDDEEIAEAARAAGAEVPFMRPAQHAQDATPDFPVFLHALDWLDKNEGYRPDLIVQLRPTSPLRPPGLVDEAVRLLMDHPEADSVRAVVEAAQNPFKMWVREGGPAVEGRGRTRWLRPFAEGTPWADALDAAGIDEAYNAPRQSLPKTYWQTGHLDAFRRRTVQVLRSLTGRHVLPVEVAPAFAVDIDTRENWRSAEQALDGGLDVVRPDGASTPPTPASGDFNLDAALRRVKLVAFDFDGVFTDNRVHVLEDGREAVVCDRSDGHGIKMLREAGIPAFVLSTEVNPVVTARCEKLKLPVQQGLGDTKGDAFRLLLEREGVAPGDALFVGNDVNDLDCLRLAGLAAAPADAHPDALAVADWTLARTGGRGAVREVCDRLLASGDGAIQRLNDWK